MKLATATRPYDANDASGRHDCSWSSHWVTQPSASIMPLPLFVDLATWPPTREITRLDGILMFEVLADAGTARRHQSRRV
ncbi:unnamed protein product [Urochloa humidicola]